LADLRGYVAKERGPVRGSYRGYESLLCAAFVRRSDTARNAEYSGRHDLRKMGAASADRYHFMAEAMRRAYADRAEYLADADFASVPVRGLIDKDYAKKLRATINPDHASTSAEIRFGQPPGQNRVRRRISRLLIAKGTRWRTATL